MKQKLFCGFCGKVIEKYPSQIKDTNFCSRACLGAFASKEKNPFGYQKLKDLSGASKHMTALNRQMNAIRMTPETRAKLRSAHLGSGVGKSYEKTYSRHTHRVIAESILGRPLKRGEVVHHVDGNRRDNSPNNLRIFGTQKEHAEYHARLDAFFGREVIR